MCFMIPSMQVHFFNLLNKENMHLKPISISSLDIFLRTGSIVQVVFIMDSLVRLTLIKLSRLIPQNWLSSPYYDILKKIGWTIYSYFLKDYKLLCKIDNSKQRIFEMKLSTSNGFPNFSPWRMIKRSLKDELWWIEAHLLLRKVVDQKKQHFEEIRHFIVYNAVFHWPQSHHLLNHGKLDVFDQMFLSHMVTKVTPQWVVHLTSVQF